MKNRRHLMIMDIIENMCIQTQEELVEELKRRGQKVTQATISRDIKELRMVKVTDAQGNHRYAISSGSEQELTDRQMRIFADSVISMQIAQNIVVIKTISGSANAAAETIDAFKWEEIVGTLAGDNTIFIVSPDADSAKALIERFKVYLH
jgi:transcriptional regulator of arginine metabolism